MSHFTIAIGNLCFKSLLPYAKDPLGEINEIWQIEFYRNKVYFQVLVEGYDRRREQKVNLSLTSGYLPKCAAQFTKFTKNGTIVPGCQELLDFPLVWNVNLGEFSFRKT